MSDAFPSHLLDLSTLLLITRSSPFTHAHSSALSTLSHLLSQYIQSLATQATQYANHSGRERVSVWDLGDAIQEFGGISLKGLHDEFDKGDVGIEEDVQGLRELAKGLQDHLATDPPVPPVTQLSYDPLNEKDLALLDALERHSFVDLVENDPSSSPSTSATSLEEQDVEELDQGREDAEEEEEEVIRIKPEPTTTSSVEDLFGDLDQVLAGDHSEEFLDSLGLGGGNTSKNATGDMTVSIFHPFDTAGRPISSIEIVQPESFDTLAVTREQESEYRPFSAWRDEHERPDYVPEWFPPFPGSEKESDQSIQSRRRKEEKERERQRAKEGANAGLVGKSRVSTALGGQGDPWSDAVPFSSSILAESLSIFPNSLPTPSSPRRQSTRPPLNTNNQEDPSRATKKRRLSRRRRSLSPPAVQPSSLPSFNFIAPLLPHPPSYLRPSQLRRSAASLISHNPHHPELQISSDSLFGLLPYVPTLRQPTLPPGFLPDFAPPLIHAFNTNLPWTVSSPVPYHPSTPTTHLSASSPTPRIPSLLSQISKTFSNPLQFDPKNPDQLHQNIGLFSRLKRIGPPGPLGSKGETLNYEYVGQTALISMNVEWSQREFNTKLPTKRTGMGGEDNVGTPGESGQGIKLKLGGSTRGGNQGGGVGGEGIASRMGSPVNGFGPSRLRRSESVVTQGGTRITTNASSSNSNLGGGGGGNGNGVGGMDLDFDNAGGQVDSEIDPFKLMMENLDSFPTTESRRNSISQQQEQEKSIVDGNHLQGDQEFEYPEWLLNGQSAPSTTADQGSIGQQGDRGNQEVDTAMIDPSLCRSSSTSNPPTPASLPSLPTLPSLPLPPRPLPPRPPPPPPPAPAPAPPSSSQAPSANMFDPSNLPPRPT
ncbi:hypothetical protein JCM16303_002790 [Sporobolomyces ruberrimus]